MTFFLIVGLTSILPGQTGTIAYITGETQETWCLSVLDVSTGAVTAIGQGARDSFPRWSPDGTRIAYQSKHPDGMGIRVANPQAGTDEPLRHSYKWNFQPGWSPDGRKLAYSSDGDAAPLSSILVYDLDTGVETIWGGERRGLMQPVWLPTTDLMKALDPDDQMAAEALGLFALKAEAEEHGVLMAIGVTGNPPDIATEIFIVTPTLAVPLLPLLMPDSHRYVKWQVSPDNKGRQIAFESNDGGDRELFVLGRKGITNVSNHPAADWNPKWSSDNEWMAFESFRDGRRGVYRVLASTANVFSVATGKNFDCWSPDWSPDGDYIVYVSGQTGTPQLFMARADGSGSKQLSNGPHPALSPVWQPKRK
ncbi:MAG TPA: hypothetical protein ENN29_01920 [Candidatus Hydrogenedentes bacterium]|nr:hypothetical protein [Candidatus Hydrogenedentota bacterium]